MTDTKGHSRRSVLKKGALATGLLFTGGPALAGTATAGVGDGRVLHFPMNDIESDGTVVDASPEENDGTNDGATVATGAGQTGNALAFDGDALVKDIGGQPGEGPLNGASACTVCAWIYPTTLSEDAGGHGGASSGSPNAVYEEGYNNGDDADDHVALQVADSGRLYGYIETNDGEIEFTSERIVESESWQHVALRYDSAAEGNELELIYNAEVKDSSSASGVIKHSEAGAVGAHNDERVGGRNHFVGRIDEVRVYDRPLSDSELDSLSTMGGNGAAPGR